MIKLSFDHPYLSVKPFSDLELPSFTLVTGLNGSGKTHLLQAIANGRIRTEGVSNVQEEIKLFDWSSFVPQGEGPYQTSQLESEQEAIFQQLDNTFRQNEEHLKNTARHVGLPHDFLVNPKAIVKLDLPALKEIFGEDAKADDAHKTLQQLTTQISNAMLNSVASNSYARFQIAQFTQQLGIQIAAYDRQTFREFAPVAWGQADLIRQSFSRLFVAYRDLHLSNEVKKVAKNHGENAEPLSQEEFERRYNIPPWVFLNQTLEDAGLDFEIDAPDLYRHSAYHARLRKKSNGAEIDFPNLSSGEKILMSFANCLYIATDTRQLSTFPKLLLLDEVDAPLHPSMSRTMIKTITQTLVNRFGINVIATTHSPSTVAVAPDEAIFVMEADHAGIKRSSKGRALNLLTSGVPTLAINVSGRRQVFVESEADAKAYDRLYDLLKPQLNSERSLTFISVGGRSKLGDIGSGVDQVKRVVSSLEAAENHSVFGLIDWDGTATPSPRIKVLAAGVRNGLENCLYDPLLVACLIVRNVPDRVATIGLRPRGGIIQMKGLAPERLQEVAAAVERLILPTKGEQTTICKYAGNFSLRLSKEYLELDDHSLEGKLVAALPALRKYTQRAGELILYLADNVIPDFMEFVPSHFTEVFTELLATEVE